jgi:phytoene synthase
MPASTLSPATAIDIDPAAQAAHCRLQLKGGSRSFHAAAFLLPAKIREPASALYAFCRMADDLIDGPGAADNALAELHERIDAIYCDRPQDHVCDQAMARLLRAHLLPKALLHALLDGFRWDAEGRGCDTLSDLLAYSARVAGSVGVMMALLMGVRQPRLLARAADLGVAMQLTNIARDVGEDAGLGRVYLPADWLRDAGVDRQAFLAQPRFSAELGSVIRRMLAVADELYQRADSGLARLPLSCRPAMYAARLLYANIGAVVVENGYDSVSSRAIVSAPRKLRILLGLTRLFSLPGDHASRAPLQETAFLVDAALAAMADDPLHSAAVPGFEHKVTWVLELFDELHRRESQSNMLLPAGKQSGAS